MPCSFRNPVHFGPGCHPGPCTGFRCQVCYSLQPGTAPLLSWLSSPQQFYNASLTCGQMTLSVVSPGPDPDHAFLMGMSREWCCALCSSPSTSRDTRCQPILPIAADINLDHLLMLVRARFLHHKDTIFLFVTNYHPWGGIFCDRANITYILKLPPSYFACLNQWP